MARGKRIRQAQPPAPRTHLGLTMADPRPPTNPAIPQADHQPATIPAEILTSRTRLHAIRELPARLRAARTSQTLLQLLTITHLLLPETHRRYPRLLPRRRLPELQPHIKTSGRRIVRSAGKAAWR